MKTKNRPWMQTASGGKFHLINPEPAQVDIKDIAEALAKQSRFGGHTQTFFYSIAQHNCLLVDLLPLAAKPYGLLHDAYTAYTGELMKPVRDMLNAKAGYDIWSIVTADIKRATHEAFGLQWPPHHAVQNMVREADRIMLATERRDILADGPNWEIPLPAPDKKTIRAWTWVEAHENFLERFDAVCKMRPDMVLAMKSFGRGQGES